MSVNWLHHKEDESIFLVEGVSCDSVCYFVSDSWQVNHLELERKGVFNEFPFQSCQITFD